MPTIAEAGDRIATGQSLLVFETGGEWQVAELRWFLTWIEVMYGVVFTLDALAEAEFRQVTSNPGLDLQLLLLQSWPAELSGQISKKYEYQREAITIKPAELDEFCRHFGRLEARMDISSLSVRSIHMASPGQISLLGLDRVLRQIREFVKDLWYRNNQEKRLGELHLEAAQLLVEELRGVQHGAVGPSRATIMLGEGRFVLDALQRAGKLPEPPTLESEGEQ